MKGEERKDQKKMEKISKRWEDWEINVIREEKKIEETGSKMKGN